MSAARQQLSAQTRMSGKLERPNGEKRRNIDSGRLSVVFGRDLLRLMCADAASAGVSVGRFAADLALAHYAAQGLDLAAIGARAAELRAAETPPEAATAPAPALPAAAV